MNGRRIDNLKTVCMTNSISNLKYAINMECLLNYTYTQLSEALFWEYYQKADAFYHLPTSNNHEVTFDPTTRKVSKLFDQSLSQDNASQTTSSLQPTICTTIIIVLTNDIILNLMDRKECYQILI